MLDGHERSKWDRLSVELCQFANANRGKNQKTHTPKDFNPFAVKKVKKGCIQDLKVFVKGATT